MQRLLIIHEHTSHVLASLNYQITITSKFDQLCNLTHNFDGVVADLSVDLLRQNGEKLTSLCRRVPLFLWLRHPSSPQTSTSLTSFIQDFTSEFDIEIDGLLTPAMSAQEILLALVLGRKHYEQRQHWSQERTKLLSKVEDQKWINLAKSILCEVNNISEPKAYDVLRKRAMNERKRIADIAITIVKAHQELQY